MRRAVGIVRVSEKKGREGERFISPGEQRKRIEEKCSQLGLELVQTEPEIDVSGGRTLDRRPVLREGVEAIEQGRAKVLVVGYFDRLVRDLKVQWEVVSRVEAAGGEVLAVDFGRISEATAVQWLSATMVGAVHEYVRRSAREKSAEAQADAVGRGVCPFSAVPPGLALDADNRVIHTNDLPTVTEAFELRDEGTTIKDVRAFLAERGIERSYHGVQSLLGNRLYLGEVHFGSLVNLHAHEPAIDRGLFERVQRQRVSRGRRAKSDRILARLGVLRCEDGARMIVGTQTQHGRRYPFYRCPTTGDCEHRVAISAEVAERVVIEATKERLREVEGRASAESEQRRLDEAAATAQADLDAAIRAFAGLDGEAAAVERITELREIRDAAKAAADQHSRSLGSALTVSVDRWDDLTLTEQRGLIRSAIRAATVGRFGKGADRIAIELFGE